MRQRLRKLRGERPDDDSPTFRAQMRSARIDLARDRANVLAEMEEIALINEGLDQTDMVLRRFDNALQVNKLTDDPRIAPLRQAVASADRDQVLSALSTLAAEFGLTRIGANPRRGPDQLLSFNRDEHSDLVRKGMLPPGRKVMLVRPGYAADIDGEAVQLEKAVVAALTPDEIQRISTATIRDGQRMLKVGRAVADLLELVGNDASMRAIRDRVGYHHDAAHAEHGPQMRVKSTTRFASPEIMAAMAGLRDEVESAQTPDDVADIAERFARELDVEIVGRPGGTLLYDPTAHEPAGGAPSIGTPVTVLRPGIREPGTGLILERARVFTM